MRLGLEQRVKKLEKRAGASFNFVVAILRPVSGGMYCDQYGKKYKKLGDCKAMHIINDNIPRTNGVMGNADN